MATALGTLVRRIVLQKAPWHLLRRGGLLGHCPICERRTIFYAEGPWLRDQYRCIRCYSVPRWRALVQVLHEEFPQWRELRLHESSPGGAASDKLRRECRHYVPTYFYSDVEAGGLRNGFRSENLERQTFEDGAFDLVITQDVMEHVLDPARAFAEIGRTLAPGGAHVFTVPWYKERTTLVRAVRENGNVRHLMEPDYHQDPIDPDGSLVVTEWGSNLCDYIAEQSGLVTSVVSLADRTRGITGDYLEVFVSRRTTGQGPQR